MKVTSFVDFFKSKQFKYGSNALLLVVFILGILVIANFLAARHQIRWDFTHDRRYSLSQQTVDTLKGLDEDIKIIGFFRPGSYTQYQVQELLREYQAHTNRITVDFVDPDRNPSEVEEYGVRAYDTTVIATEDRVNRIRGNQLFEFTQQERRFKGEQIITQALMDITRDTEDIIYFVEGHGEAIIDRGIFMKDVNELKDQLTGEGFTIEKLNISHAGEIPKDANLVVIAGPERDFSSGEREHLEEYLNRGGRALFLLDPTPRTEEDLINLEEVIGNWGITLRNDVVVDPRQSYFFDPLTPVADPFYHEITADMLERRFSVVMPFTRSMERTDPEEMGDTEVKLLLRTSENAWSHTDFKADELKKPDDVDGKRLELAYAISSPAQAGGGGDLISREMKAAVIGSSSFIKDQIIVQQGNMDFVMNTINWLLDREDKISIRPRDITFRWLTLTGNQSRYIFYGTVGVLPFLVFLCGGIIWFRRRHL